MSGAVDEAVRRAFSSARENGYNFENWTVEEIADDMMDCDMMDCDADIAELPPADVRQAVQSYLRDSA